MHAGGQDLPMHDQRLDPGFAIAYALEPTPGKHTNYCYMYLEMFAMHKTFPGVPAVDMVYRKAGRLSVQDRELALAAASKLLQIANGAGACLFALHCGPNYPLLKYLNAATGWNKSPAEYLEIGERIQALRQAFNVKHGKWPSRDFRLPPRTLGEPPLDAGPLKGIRIPFEELSRNFLKTMNWDEQGRPSPERLNALGLTEAAREIEAMKAEG
jgi:aldehyde:ferredoxin oxidoreductase